MTFRYTFWLIIILTLFSLWVNLPDFPKVPKTVSVLGKNIQLTGLFPVKLGLDLQGGTQLVLQADMSKIDAASQADALESARNVIEKRVNLYGVSESLVQSSKFGGQSRILVELPGVKDSQTAVNLVGKTAELEFREYDSSSAANLKQNLGTSSADPDSIGAEASNSALIDILSYKATGVTGADLKKASVTYGASNNANSSPQVSIQFTSDGAKKFAQVTKRNIGKPLGMFLDGQPIEWPPPIVNQEIIGDAVISGNFTLEQAKNLAIELNAGALPVPVKIIEQRSIGASLGNVSVQKSLIAGVIGIITVMVFMIAYYGFYGLVADIALIIYSLLVMTIFKTGLFIMPPVTLTLAGIAGFILSVGMAVDANVLTFERVKEEIKSGKDKKTALNLGFTRSWPSIRDSNVSSLMTASILYMLGTSVVRGFAVTLFIGVVVSMFTAILVTRTLLKILVLRNLKK